MLESLNQKSDNQENYKVKLYFSISKLVEITKKILILFHTLPPTMKRSFTNGTLCDMYTVLYNS